MFTASKWEGLAKIGKVVVNTKSFTTPTLFPVVDPFQQSVNISRLKSEFGFDQVITSSYLMSKRFSTEEKGELILPNFSDLPKINSYLDYDGVIMMDSGAYQVLLYDDIELGVVDTLELQKSVQPDFGVIMDHPIGYATSYNEAKTRIKTTIDNLKTSINYFHDSNISWTLPIQGGKYLDLMNYYLGEVMQEDIVKHFSLFALGSVVPVMINQDYSTLVRMIATARYSLPVTHPLHLFGAGHPAMFALTVYLGCDTFDSAAYALMAKDGRYLTVYGTLQLDSLDEFPCSCKICSKYTVREFHQLERQQRIQFLSEHNLWESVAEIKRIRQAIKMGRLWDLVKQRASSAPYLARATRLASTFVTSGKLSKLYSEGLPTSLSFAPRITRSSDLDKFEYHKIREFSQKYISENPSDHIFIIGYDMQNSIFNKLVDKQLKDELKSILNYEILLLLPPLGIVPLGLNEMFPVAQLIHELDLQSFDFGPIKEQLTDLCDKSKNFIHLILAYEWPESVVQEFEMVSNNLIVHTEKKPLGAIRDIVNSFSL